MRCHQCGYLETNPRWQIRALDGKAYCYSCINRDRYALSEDTEDTP